MVSYGIRSAGQLDWGKKHSNTRLVLKIYHKQTASSLENPCRQKKKAMKWEYVKGGEGGRYRRQLILATLYILNDCILFYHLLAHAQAGMQKRNHSVNREET